MTNITESAWYIMMGLSKMFLRNVIIGCFIALMSVVVVLSILLYSTNVERLRDERAYRTEVVKLKEDCDKMKEIKNEEYNNLLREALSTQQKIDREIQNLKVKTYRK